MTGVSQAAFFKRIREHGKKSSSGLRAARIVRAFDEHGQNYGAEKMVPVAVLPGVAFRVGKLFEH